MIEDDLRGIQELELEQQRWRWQHLVPKAEDKRLIREYWEWFANIDNPRTRRADQNDLEDLGFGEQWNQKPT